MKEAGRVSIRDRIVGLVRVRAGELVPHPENWRRHPDRQRKVLADMLAEVGIADAVIARRLDDGRLQLIDGHLRAGIDDDLEIPVLVLDVDEHEARKLLVSLDPLAAMAKTASDKLAALAASISPDTDGLADLLRTITGDAAPPAGLDDTPTLKGRPTSRAGDLWILDGHRILCGDATSRADLKRLMDGDKAACVFTDPPYGDNITARLNAVTRGSQATILNDELSRDQLTRLLVGSLRNALAHATPTAAFYVWHASSTSADFAWACAKVGLEIRETIIWVKPAAPISWADYLWAHEPCFYAVREGEAPAFYGPRSQTTVWRIGRAGRDTAEATLGSGLLLSDGEAGELYLAPAPPKNRKVRHLRVDTGAVRVAGSEDSSTVWEVGRDTASPEHPTQKPVELARRALRNSTRAGEIVLDVFLGSGTTLIGAETLGRRCYAVDLDPKYVDVACARWQRLTGRQPILERTGKPHDFRPRERERERERERAGPDV